ncbi:MAG: UDPGP type 1 family protein [Planctomycetia bacterium]|jgi:UDP-N-acetylglucosamine/UDP-N-acetylgalactosamine diphosphorylase
MNQELNDLLRPYGQEHLIAFWDELSPDRQEELAGQIHEIDFAQLAKLYEDRDKAQDFESLIERSTPPPAFRLDKKLNRFSPEEAKTRAAEVLAEGKVGVILVAGGQGTRLGFKHPKGMYRIGPVSDATLFQIHIEKVRALAKQYGCSVPLYVMTSPATHDETVEFLEQNDRFGLPAEDLILFCQGTMPAVDMATGKVLLAEKGQLALSPDGHGGMLAALKKSGALADVQRRGVEHLFYLQVDNPLVDIGGEEFLGYHLLSDSELSSQVVAKQDPLEPVGCVVQVDNQFRVIEYSDLKSSKKVHERLPDGSLEVWAGSIAVHVMEVALLARMADQAEALPFHIARKKVAHVDETGHRVEPGELNAIKFERFIFDLLPAAKNAVVVEIDPREGFAPLKNASGKPKDTPEYVREYMVALHRRWLAAAGVEVAEGIPVEISPLLARTPEQVAERVERGTRVSEPTYLF